MDYAQWKERLEKELKEFADNHRATKKEMIRACNNIEYEEIYDE